MMERFSGSSDRRNRFRIAALAPLLIVLLFAIGPPGHAAGNSARAALSDATAAATKWQPDAILTSIYAANVDLEGKSTTWSYGFYSPKARSFLNVTARGRSISTLEIGTGQTERIPPDFVDSDVILAEAVKAGIKAESVRVRLTRTEWVVNSGDQKGALSVWLNPRTGRLIKRQTVQ